MRNFVIILVFIFFSGCGASLRTLMQLDSEQKEQQAYVKLQQHKFKLLLKDIKKNRIKRSEINKENIIKLYGEPIMEKKIDDKQVLLYREPLEFFPAQKVYLFFDKDGILSDFEVETKDSQK